MPCPPNDGGGPDLLTLTVLEAGTDLDLGWTGVNHEREAEGVPVRDDACGGSGCGAPCLPGSPACATMAPDPTDPGGAAVCVGSKGGISQVCCRGDRKIPCFPTADGTLVRTGRAVPPTPAWPSPDYPKDATGVVLAATQCHAATTAFGVDQVSGLPGPLALLLSTRAVWQKP